MQLGFILLTILSMICLGYGYGATEMLPSYNAVLAAKVIPHPSGVEQRG